MKLPVPMQFEWDDGNIDKNWTKHRVHYRETEEVFFNKPLKILRDIKHSKVEKRFFALGLTYNTRLLLISFTIRSQRIRVISARDLNRKEKNLYEKE